jgi:hypothetical protein
MSKIRLNSAEFQVFLDWLKKIIKGFPTLKVLSLEPFKIELVEHDKVPSAIQPEFLVEPLIDQRALVLNLKAASPGAWLARGFLTFNPIRTEEFEFTSNKQIKIHLDRCHAIFSRLDIESIEIRDGGIDASFQVRPKW